MDNHLESFNLEQIIRDEALVSHFQPIVSIRQKDIIGLEALSRGLTPEGKTIPPKYLFDAAAASGLSVELDRLCRKKALEHFADIARTRSEMVISLNFDTALVDMGVVGSGHLFELVEQNGIRPENVLIEIIESKVKNLDALAEFVEVYRAHGFLIALDDFGAGHSNLDRLSFIKPDVIKIDRGLVDGIERNAHKQEVVKSLTGLSRKIGALVIAEGVEQLMEVVVCQELGVDMFQGYFFAKPQPFEESYFSKVCEKIEPSAGEFQKYFDRKIKARRSVHDGHRMMVQQLLDRLSDSDLAETENKLGGILKDFPPIECLYILDESGQQASGTIEGPAMTGKREHRLFQPARRGTDQSAKEYFLYLQSGLDRFVTEPYLSLASGKRCFTISTWFKDITGKPYVLCLDIVPGD